MANVWTLTELCRTLSLKPATVKAKITKKEFGTFRKVGDDMWRFEDGAIQNYKLRVFEARDEKRSETKKARPKKSEEYVYFPSHTTEEAELLADEMVSTYKEKNIDLLNSLDSEEAAKRINNYWKLNYGKLMSLKKRVKVSDVSEAEKRLAFVAPVFIADRLSAMRDEDASYFISEWTSYVDQGWDVVNPIFRFFIGQMIEEQINTRRLQSVISVHEMGVPEALEKSLTASLKRFSDIVKQLNSAKYPERADDNQNQGGGNLFDNEGDAPKMM